MFCYRSNACCLDVSKKPGCRETILVLCCFIDTLRFNKSWIFLITASVLSVEAFMHGATS